MGNNETEIKILKAAKTEFLSNGYNGARMRSIAEYAGINKGLLHYYFKSKEALVIQVFQDTFGELFNRLDVALDEKHDLFEQIEALVSVYTDFLCRHPDLPHFVVMEMKRDPKAHTGRMKKAGVHPPFHRLKAPLEKAQKDGLVSNDLTVQTLVLNSLSLLFFPIIAKPMVKFMHDLNEIEYKQLVKQRKTEVAAFLINGIKIKAS